MRQEPLTGEQAAFFWVSRRRYSCTRTAHAIAVLAFGGKCEFGYRVSGGYVKTWEASRRSRTGSSPWWARSARWLARALWLVLRRHESRLPQYSACGPFASRLFSYPCRTIFSLFFADWRLAHDHDFAARRSERFTHRSCPVVAAVWRADRARMFEMTAFDFGRATHFEATRTAPDRGDPAARLQVIDELWRGGAGEEARRALDAGSGGLPAIGRWPSAIGRFQATEGRQPFSARKPIRAAGKALSLGLSVHPTEWLWPPNFGDSITCNAAKGRRPRRNDGRADAGGSLRS